MTSTTTPISIHNFGCKFSFDGDYSCGFGPREAFRPFFHWPQRWRLKIPKHLLNFKKKDALIPRREVLFIRASSSMHSSMQVGESSKSSNFSYLESSFINNKDIFASPTEGDELLSFLLGEVEEIALPDDTGMRSAARTSATINNDHVQIIHGDEELLVFNDGEIQLTRMKENNKVLVSYGRVNLPHKSQCAVANCEFFVQEEPNGSFIVNAKWDDDAILRIAPSGTEMAFIGCKASSANSNWSSKLEGGFICEFTVKHVPGVVDMAEVVLDMKASGHWFGGGHFMRQHWPLNLGAFEVGPFFPFDNGPNGVNTLLSAQFMTSKGLLVLADPDIPFFHVGLNAPVEDPNGGWIQRKWGTGVQNLTKEYLPSLCQGNGDGLLRLQARHDYKSFEMLHPLRDWFPVLENSSKDSQKLSVRFAVCAQPNVKEAAMAALKTLNRPSNPPPEEMIKAPIWTTWARYHAKVNQHKVEMFANEIVARGLPKSVMEIDDKWQSKYGDFDFDPVKFPDPKAMVDLLHALGFKVTLWIMPFAEEASNAYKEGAPKGYFISSDAPPTRGLKPGFFRWWQPVPAAALDVTNPEAVKWFVNRLKKLQKDYNIDGFKFDAGEPCFLPPKFKTFSPIHTPSDYTRLYVQEVASNFELAEVRTGHQTTNVSLLTRMGDRFSTWGSGNGLRSVIPTLLTSGLLGYPFCLPDMIGGNGYFGRKPDVELLVRWAQANAFMPAMQFSIAPWDLNQEAEKLCRHVLELRDTIISQILQLMEDSCKKLTPVCRPMWWLDPEDPETFAIDDQFSIGDDLIIAPVVDKGKKQRDVYLPKGLWMELLNPNEVIQGPCWLRNIDAPLHKVPIYRRVIPQLSSPLLPPLASTLPSPLSSPLLSYEFCPIPVNDTPASVVTTTMPNHSSHANPLP